MNLTALLSGLHSLDGSQTFDSTRFPGSNHGNLPKLLEKKSICGIGNPVRSGRRIRERRCKIVDRSTAPLPAWHASAKFSARAQLLFRR